MFETLKFEFERLGPLGINLKSCLNGYGAYIDSFYDNNTSLAWKEGMAVGDVIIALNSKSIVLMDLDEVKSHLIQLRNHALTITVHRLATREERQSRLSREEVIKDLRNRLFVRRFMKESIAVREEAQRKYDLYCRVRELLLCISYNPTPSNCAYDVELINDYQEMRSDSSPLTLIRCERALRDDLLHHEDSSWIDAYITSDLFLKKIAYYHRYPDIDFVPLSSVVDMRGLHLCFAWHLFLLTHHRFTMLTLKILRSLSEGDLAHAPDEVSSYLEELVSYCASKDHSVLRFYESELYQSFYQVTHDPLHFMTPYNFLMHCLETIISLPPYVILHFSARDKVSKPQNPSTHMNSVGSSDIIAGVMQVKAIADADSPSTRYESRKLLLGNLRHHEFPYHPCIKELRKLPSLYFLPQANELLSGSTHNDLTDTANDDRVSLRFRSFILESFSDLSSLSSHHSSHSVNGSGEGGVGSDRFYYGCQAILSSPSFIHQYEVDNGLEFPHYIECIETRELELVESNRARKRITRDIQAEKENEKEDEEVDETDNHEGEDMKHLSSIITDCDTSLPSSIIASAAGKLVLWGQRYRSSSTVKEDLASIREKLSSSLSRVTLLSSSRSVTEPVLPSNFEVNKSISEPLPTEKDSESSEEGFELSDEESHDSAWPSEALEAKLNISMQQKTSADHTVSDSMLPNDPITNKKPCLLALTLLSKTPQHRSLMRKLSATMKDILVQEDQFSDALFTKLLQTSLNIVSGEGYDTSRSQQEVQPSEDELEFPLAVVCEVFPPMMLLVLYFLVLLEVKVAFIISSDDNGDSVDDGYRVIGDTFIVFLYEWLKLCIKPLTWQYPITFSLLPLPAVREMIHCPTSFFIGMTSSTYKELLKEEVLKVSPDLQQHNVSNLVLVDVKLGKMIFPHSDYESKEIRFLQQIHYYADQIKQASSPIEEFPLFRHMKRIFNPNLSSYSRQAFPFLPIASSKMKTRIIEEFKSLPLPIAPLATASSLDSILNMRKESSVNTSSDCISDGTLLLLLQSFTSELLLGVEDCCLPLVSQRKESDERKVEQILFQSDSFFSIKHHQITTSASYPSILLIPSFPSFLQSFVHTQTFSHLISKF